MPSTHWFSCRSCRLTVISTSNRCALCAYGDGQLLTERIRRLLAIKRGTEASRARVHADELACSGVA